jgi:hypothetical protein
MPHTDSGSWKARACGLLVALGLASAEDLAASAEIPLDDIMETYKAFKSGAIETVTDATQVPDSELEDGQEQQDYTNI